MRLRLVGGELCPGPSAPITAEIVLAALRVAEKALALAGHAVPLGAMTAPVRHGVPAEAPRGDEPIAGTIQPTTPPFNEAVELWLAHLAAKGKTPGTIASFRGVIEQGRAACGWFTATDLTADSLMGWMDAKRAAGDWKGVTLNRNACAFRSFTKWLLKTGRIAADPLADFDRADDDSDHGARALTTDEARAIIGYAWAKQKTDARCKGNRALYWLVCCTMGCRYSEPANWKWRGLHLDDPIPTIAWERLWHKAGTLATVVIPPEAAELLRAHRETVPHGPDDPVFPIVPPRVTFRSDRDAAGVEVLDRLGMRASSHSMRKWCATTLQNLGVPARMCDKLVRHSGGVEGRYYRPTPEEMKAAVDKLPRLWPGDTSDAGQPPRIRNRERRFKNRVEASRHSGTFIGPGTRLPGGSDAGNVPMLTATFNPDLPPRAADALADVAKESHLSPDAGSVAAGYAGVESTPIDVAGNRHSRIQLDGLANLAASDRDDVADFLEATARLIRRARRDGGAA